MIDFGATLRQAREAKGLTLNDVATTTHMMVQMVEDLENERFGRIAAPIYGRGFVKLYCEAVGIDDYKPLVAEFMEIFNGNRPPTIRMREEPPPAPPEPAPEPERTAEPERAAEFERAAAPEPAPGPESEPVADGGFRLEQETAAPAFAPLPEPEPAPTRPLSRYAPPTPLAEEATREPFTFPEIPPVVWRVLALLVVAGAILWLVFYLGRGLYRATMIAPEGTPPAVEETAKPGATAAPATAPAATSAAAPRTPLEVPPLYID
jgi:transcriptional regulator with XRE-family HTH domain